MTNTIKDAISQFAEGFVFMAEDFPIPPDTFQTAKHFNIIPAFVEKDYWITLVLSRLSQSENVENAVFKGATSLSNAENARRSLSAKIRHFLRRTLLPQKVLLPL
ncbi:MAG: hypothetical protein LBP83_00215 [Dysgonamonadaceae bacterium]|nr:hypothetical protein [Dysgonamonadaceae bacterium]